MKQLEVFFFFFSCFVWKPTSVNIHIFGKKSKSRYRVLENYSPIFVLHEVILFGMEQFCGGVSANLPGKNRAKG